MCHILSVYTAGLACIAVCCLGSAAAMVNRAAYCDRPTAGLWRNESLTANTAKRGRPLDNHQLQQLHGVHTCACPYVLVLLIILCCSFPKIVFSDPGNQQRHGCSAYRRLAKHFHNICTNTSHNAITVMLSSVGWLKT